MIKDWFKCESCELLHKLLMEERANNANLLRIVLEQTQQPVQQFTGSGTPVADFEHVQRKPISTAVQRAALEIQSAQKQREIDAAKEEQLVLEDLEKALNE